MQGLHPGILEESHRGEIALFFPYAETHFKFRLPWSPLYKPWPEMILDAPFQVLPGKPFSVYLLVKDADLYPVVIHSLKLRLQDSQGNVVEQEHTLNVSCETNLFHQSFSLSREGLRGDIRLWGWITAENARGKAVRFLCHNFPGLEKRPLEIRLLEHALPHPQGWFAGEMHCHSEFSSDPVEFGAPLRLMQETANSVGLDFVLCTDHSYDFNYRRDRFLEFTNADVNFAEYQKQAYALNSERPDFPTLVPGEEVSCGNSRGENVHLLVFGHEKFLPGLGDGGRRGFNNHPDLSLTEVLNRLNGVPTFAAHPKAKIGWLERKIFRRGEWREEDVVSPSLRGLQFWNGNLGADYRDGKAFWIQQLLQGRKILPIAANDAHGDFNQNIGVKLPLISLYQARSHVFGKVRTMVPSPTKSIADLRTAFLGESCVCTDGPFVNLTFENSRVKVEASSSGDFGSLQSVVIYGGKTGAQEEVLCKEWRFNEATMGLDETLPAPVFDYIRVEAVTRNGNRALSSALFIS